MDGGRKRWNKQGRRNPNQSSMAPQQAFGGFSLSKDLKHDRRNIGDGQTGCSGPSANNLMGRGISPYCNSNERVPVDTNGTVNPAAIQNMINKLMPMVTASLAGKSSEFNSDDGDRRVQMSGLIPDRGLSTVFQNNAPSHEGAQNARWSCEKCQFLNFPNRTNCNKCGVDKTRTAPTVPQLTGNAIQDWNCAKCQYLNFHHRNKCYKCGTCKTEESNGNPKAGANSASAVFEKKPKSTDDWVCTRCQNLNYRHRKLCNRCKTHRESSDGKTSEGCNNLPLDQFIRGNRRTNLGNDQHLRLNTDNELLPAIVRKMATEEITDRIVNGQVPIASGLFGDQMTEQAKRIAAEDIATKIIDGCDLGIDIMTPAQQQAIDEMRAMAAEGIAKKILKGGGSLNPTLLQNINNMIAKPVLPTPGIIPQPLNLIPAIIPPIGVPGSVNLLPRVIPPASVQPGLIQPLLGPNPNVVPLLLPQENQVPPVSMIQQPSSLNTMDTAPTAPLLNPVIAVEECSDANGVFSSEAGGGAGDLESWRAEELDRSEAVIPQGDFVPFPCVSSRAIEADKYSNYRRARNERNRRRRKNSGTISLSNSNSKESLEESVEEIHVTKDKEEKKGDDIIDLISSDSDADDVIDLTDENLNLHEDVGSHSANEEGQKEKDLSNPLFTIDDDSDEPMYTVVESPASCDELYVSDDDGPMEPTQKIPMWTRSSDIGMIGLLPQVSRPEYGESTNAVEYIDTEQEKAQAFLARNEERCRSKERDRSETRESSKEQDNSQTRPTSMERDHSKSHDRSKSRAKSKERDHSPSRDESKTRGRSEKRDCSKTRDASKESERSRERKRNKDTGSSDESRWVDRYGRSRPLPEERYKRKKRKVTTDELLGTLDEMGLLSEGTPEIKGPLKDPHVENGAPPIVTIL